MCGVRIDANFCRIILLRLSSPREHGGTPGTSPSAVGREQKILSKVTRPGDRDSGRCIPDCEFESIGLDGSISSKKYAFPSRKHMTERPIHELYMR